MKKVAGILFILIFIASCKSDDDTSSNNNEGYTLVWSDEFDGALDENKWNFELGNGTDYGLPPGWGNGEFQIYTNSQNNAIVKPDGEGNTVLAIVAQDVPYTSAKLTSENLHSVRFGRVEARIKVPKGKGMWPAFWMLGDNRTEIGWPGCGEIDIMEVIGHETNVVNSTVHYANSENKLESNGFGYDAGVDLSADYHEYRLDWTPEMIHFFLDGTETHQVPIEGDMKEFLRSFYLILNVAVGGTWPGPPDETTSFPQEMLIDWVRVYTKDGLTPDAPPPLNIEEETIGQISFSLPPHAFNDNFETFSNMAVKSFGDGGEPEISLSDMTVDGDSSLLFTYPGISWGGAFFILDPPVDASQFANGNLKFSLKTPPELANLEIKLESIATAVSLYLADYTGVDVGNGFMEYTIPMSDFVDLDITDLSIPFALWNPWDADNAYLECEVLLDNIYFEE